MLKAPPRISKSKGRISTGTRPKLPVLAARSPFRPSSTAKKAKALNILKEGKPQRNAAGHITKAASYQSRELPQARVEPNRKWFGNTRVISQDALSSFRAAMAERAADPYTVLLKSNKLPLSLIRDAPNVGENGLKQHRAKMAVDSEPFGEVFGPRAQRKRVKLSVGTMGDLVGEAEKRRGDYAERMENARTADAGQNTQPGGEPDAEQAGTLATAREPIFNKGQSKRIWNELYKVIDSSDVVIHVLDARDPLGTRCRGVEKHIKEEAPHKHLIFVLNKCDLVPTGVAVSLASFRFDNCTLLRVPWRKSRTLPAMLCSVSWRNVCYSRGRSKLSSSLVAPPQAGRRLRLGDSAAEVVSVLPE